MKKTILGFVRFVSKPQVKITSRVGKWYHGKKRFIETPDIGGKITECTSNLALNWNFPEFKIWGVKEKEKLTGE